MLRRAWCTGLCLALCVLWACGDDDGPGPDTIDGGVEDAGGSGGEGGSAGSGATGGDGGSAGTTGGSFGDSGGGGADDPDGGLDAATEDACTASTEVCDAIDNDCDSNVDESLSCSGCDPACDDNADCDVDMCVCRAGYMGDGVMCEDIDECLTDNGGCDAIATCFNQEGAPALCECPVGYIDVSGACVPALTALSTSSVLNRDFDAHVRDYSISVPLAVSTITLSASVVGGVSLRINGDDVSSGTTWTSPLLNLASDNEVTIEAIVSGRMTGTYRVRIDRGHQAQRLPLEGNTTPCHGLSMISGDGNTLALRGTDCGDNQEVCLYARQGIAGWAAQGCASAPNAEAGDHFGAAFALSADGDTLVVGAPAEDSAATGVDGDDGDDSALDAGAVYVFVRDGATWSLHSYVKASNSDAGDRFGASLALSADGDVLVVGAPDEDGGATGTNGDGDDDSVQSAGAAYVFARVADAWSQTAYLKASDPQAMAGLGASVALSADGARVVVGAPDAEVGGAAYAFDRDGDVWHPATRLLASSADGGDEAGRSVAISADGAWLAIGAPGESSDATTIDGDEQDNSSEASGAVYVWRWIDGDWQAQAYLKPFNNDADDRFGSALAFSADGHNVVVFAPGEDSSATGIDGDGADDTRANSGAGYVFSRSADTWSARAYLKAIAFDGSNALQAPAISGDGNTLVSGPDVYVRTLGQWHAPLTIKPSNTDAGDLFGTSISYAADGTRMAIGAPGEDGNATTINGNAENDSAADAGAAFVFRREGSRWVQEAYLKAINAQAGDQFGYALAMSGDGSVLAVSAPYEASTGSAAGPSNNQAPGSGAAYVFTRDGDTWTHAAYVKASVNGGVTSNDLFGWSIALSSDGNTLAVGAPAEDSNVDSDGDELNGAATDSGAVYVYVRDADVWQRQAFLKAAVRNSSATFGYSVALSGDGDTLAIGAAYDGMNPIVPGAAYVFARDAGLWSQQARLSASMIGEMGGRPELGRALALSLDGERLAVGAPADAMGTQTGRVLLFERDGDTWGEPLHLQPTVADTSDLFGYALAFTPDARTLVIGAPGEDGGSSGVDRDDDDDSAQRAGAAYVWIETESGWVQAAYVKARRAAREDQLGASVAACGTDMSLGLPLEDTRTVGLNGPPLPSNAINSGSVQALR